MDGSSAQLINCGPTCATMAIKWADSTFDKTVADTRAMFDPDGGEWSTRNVNDYLQFYGIKDSAVNINNIDILVKTNIDKNQRLIFCVDVHYIKSFDDVSYHHINKNYVTGQPNTAHFIFVKGYKQTDNGFYLEVDDPWSAGELYFPSVIPGELRGQDRYYLDKKVS